MSSERLVLFAFFLFRLQIFLEATPIVSLESLPLESYTILRKFDPIEHIPVASRNLAPEYFTHRNRTVYLTDNQQWVVKIWEEHYPSVPLFVKAFQSGFYNDISQIEALIFDDKGNCRGYITPYVISRNFHRKEWEEKGFALEKNAIGVNVFSPAGKQPKIYQDFFRQLVKKTRETGFFSSDFSPNNIVIDPASNRLYLIDLEDILELEKISLEDPEIQMVLIYNPTDYLKIFGLY